MKIFSFAKDISGSACAWHPLTPRGAATFAHATAGRLWVMQFLFAALAAASVVWLFQRAWFPAVAAAIDKLPGDSEIRSGKLEWPASWTLPHVLHEGHFLAFTVDLKHESGMRSPAHVQVEFGERTVRFISLLGYVDYPYPPGDRIIGFNRPELQPWWGAWRTPILWLTVVTAILGLMVIWALLAAAFAFPVWLAGFFANRNLTFRGSWKLAGAALMPGSLLMTAAICFYALGALDLVQLAAAAIGHVVFGLVWALAAAFAAPALTTQESVKGNPFSRSRVEKPLAGAPEPPSSAPLS